MIGSIISNIPTHSSYLFTTVNVMCFFFWHFAIVYLYVKFTLGKERSYALDGIPMVKGIFSLGLKCPV